MVFGDNSGIICIAQRENTSNEFSEHFFQFPEEMTKLNVHVDAYYMFNDMWFCPNLLSARSRRKANILATPSAWADLDECQPEQLLIVPSVLVESSPRRWQAYWRVDDLAPLDAELLSKRIAYYHADEGADKSGWDLTQLLRIPNTLNFKYDNLGPIIVSKVITAPGFLYKIEDFDVYPTPKEFTYTDIPMPDEFPTSAEVWTKYHSKLPPIAWSLYDTDPRVDQDWSGLLWQLEQILFECDVNIEEVFSIVDQAKCNKYKRDQRSPQYLWREVCRAWQAHELKVHESGPSVAIDYVDDLLTEEERQHCRDNPGFVETYIEWAKTLGDAAWQYHQAGAFIILSALLSGSVKLETSYGTVVPNLWFMILADTTLTRKTTAMDVAMDLLTTVDDNAVLATDGSIEGLFTAIGTRPNRPSIFLRDEFTGLLDSMTKKDYMAGMAETLTKLYDGKYQKRLLKRETVEVKDPILIMFAGGIKNRTYELLTYEHVASGFLPRFVFITAEADITKLRPLGPPTTATSGEKERLLRILRDMQEHYSAKQKITVNQQVQTSAPKQWKATLTPEAWYRYNVYETAMLRASQESIHVEVLMPMFDRLSKSGLKAAILMSATRMEEEVVVTEDDIIRAFYYVEQWRAFSMEIVRNIGKTNFEKSVDSCIAIVKHSPGIYRSDIMRKLHLTSRTADELLTTLEQRGLIITKKNGKAINVYLNEVKE